MRAVLDAVGDGPRVLIGELYLPIERLMAYYGATGRRTCRSNFHLLRRRGTRAAIAALVERYEAALPDGAWPNWVLGNHDRPRLASRVGAGAGARRRGAAAHPARHADALLRRRARHARRRDPAERTSASIAVGVRPATRSDPDAVGCRRHRSRPRPSPGCRSPPTTAGQRRIPADDPSSLLALYRLLLALRRTEPDLRTGAYRTISADDNVLRFARGETFEVTIDFETGAAARRGAQTLARSGHGPDHVNEWWPSDSARCGVGVQGPSEPRRARVPVGATTAGLNKFSPAGGRVSLGGRISRNVLCTGMRLLSCALSPWPWRSRRRRAPRP